MAGSNGGDVRTPGGYRFLRVVLIVGAIGFAVIGVIYLINGQMAPGIFALVLAAIEAAALPLFRKLLETSQPPATIAPHDSGAPDTGTPAHQPGNARRDGSERPPH